MSVTGHIEMLIRKRLRSPVILASQASKIAERIRISKTHLVEVMRFLRHDPDAAMDLLLDISCIEHLPHSQTSDWNTPTEQTFLEIYYLMRSSKLGYRVCISVLVDEIDPSVPSLSTVFLSSVWLERELWDMFGIYVEGHPSLRRLIMYTGFSGHPMRRSYPIGKEQALVPIYQSSSKSIMR